MPVLCWRQQAGLGKGRARWCAWGYPCWLGSVRQVGGEQSPCRRSTWVVGVPCTQALSWNRGVMPSSLVWGYHHQQQEGLL